MVATASHCKLSKQKHSIIVSFLITKQTEHILGLPTLTSVNLDILATISRPTVCTFNPVLIMTLVATHKQRAGAQLHTAGFLRKIYELQIKLVEILKRIYLV